VGELLPILGGVIVGVGVTRLRPRGQRWPWLLAGGIVAGVLAAWVNGELEASVGFVIVDVPLATLSAIAVSRLMELPALRYRTGGRDS
jgi:hypothetical protein